MPLFDAVVILRNRRRWLAACFSRRGGAAGSDVCSPASSAHRPCRNCSARPPDETVGSENGVLLPGRQAKRWRAEHDARKRNAEQLRDLRKETTKRPSCAGPRIEVSHDESEPAQEANPEKPVVDGGGGSAADPRIAQPVQALLRQPSRPPQPVHHRAPRRRRTPGELRSCFTRLRQRRQLHPLVRWPPPIPTSGSARIQ
jgi:hypothetical protein